MKKVISILTTVFTLILGSCASSSNKNEPSNTSATQTSNLDTTKLKSGEIFYQCEMNPEIVSDKPGSCSVCGMDLEKVSKK